MQIILRTAVRLYVSLNLHACFGTLVLVLHNYANYPQYFNLSFESTYIDETIVKFFESTM